MMAGVMMPSAFGRKVSHDIHTPQNDKMTQGARTITHFSDVKLFQRARAKFADRAMQAAEQD
jgi:hypothetical protein